MQIGRNEPDVRSVIGWWSLCRVASLVRTPVREPERPAHIGSWERSVGLGQDFPMGAEHQIKNLVIFSCVDGDAVALALAWEGTRCEPGTEVGQGHVSWPPRGVERRLGGIVKTCGWQGPGDHAATS